MLFTEWPKQLRHIVKKTFISRKQQNFPQILGKKLKMGKDTDIILIYSM